LIYCFVKYNFVKSISIKVLAKGKNSATEKETAAETFFDEIEHQTS
jgi:hypothetical protein